MQMLSFPEKGWLFFVLFYFTRICDFLSVLDKLTFSTKIVVAFPTKVDFRQILLTFPPHKLTLYWNCWLLRGGATLGALPTLHLRTALSVGLIRGLIFRMAFHLAGTDARRVRPSFTRLPMEYAVWWGRTRRASVLVKWSPAWAVAGKFWFFFSASNCQNVYLLGADFCSFLRC